MSQPSLPFPVGGKRKRAIDVSAADLDIVAGRCSAEGLRVIGMRFDGDPLLDFFSERLTQA